MAQGRLGLLRRHVPAAGWLQPTLGKHNKLTVGSRRDLAHAACCTLHATCCTLHATCCMLHAAFCTLHAACCILHAACSTLLIRLAAANEASHMTLDAVLSKLETALRDRGARLPRNISR